MVMVKSRKIHCRFKHLYLSCSPQNPIVREIGHVDFSCLDIMCTYDN